ncbi:Protein downstream neighbor of son homolog [Linum perenne]
MAKVAQPGSLPPNSHQIGAAPLNVGPMAKRKTPSELRLRRFYSSAFVLGLQGEQLRRPSLAELLGKSQASMLDAANGEVENGLKKPDVSRNPKYTDTRLNELYPVKKSRFGTLPVKGNAKENKQPEKLNNLKSLSTLTSLAAKRRQVFSEEHVAPEDLSEDGITKAQQTIGKCSQNIFRSVTEISSYGKQSPGLATVDMDKALKGLTSREPASNFSVNTDSSGKSGQYPDNFCSECCVPGKKPPLDFTLKTKMRLLCSCSVSGLHRSMTSSTYNSSPQFMFQQGYVEDNNGLLQTLTSQICSSKSLHSWIYPQSTLPPAVISVLTSSAAERDFLRRRQFDWEESFRSLYYMFRRNICSLFYVCTSHFVVMFTSCDSSGDDKALCNAYISQSTRSLRSLLSEHDVCFSMPHCHSKVEQVATEHLVELSEIRRQNLGQTRKSSALNDVDNTPQSLLAFNKNKDVQGLYDFLLNYRSFSTILSGMDVPMLYSPIPFPNAALSAPEVRCVDMKKARHGAAVSPKDDSSIGLSSIIEVKGTYLPPWIISRICALMSNEETSFEASFATEPKSVGLNVALDKAHDFKSDSDTVEAVVTPCLSSGFLKGLKYKDDSYLASLSPL